MDSKNVFINCPFDNKYFPLLKPLLFTIIYLDLVPKISETSDSGQIRLNKIKELMSESKYSIHDLSRMEPLKENDFPRFNISGNDIKAHHESPEQLVKTVRDWFKSSLNNVPMYKEIWLGYNEFEFDYEKILKENEYNPKDIYALTFSDIIENMQVWVKKYKN
jgi:hypothetical protein